MAVARWGADATAQLRATLLAWLLSFAVGLAVSPPPLRNCTTVRNWFAGLAYPSPQYWPFPPFDVVLDKPKHPGGCTLGGPKGWQGDI